MIKRFSRALKDAFAGLFKINDSPQRVALGAGLGVFLGIIPGTGPIAALFLALFLPVNRAAILLGVLLTNTWVSVVTFFLSIKIGSAIMNLNWQEVSRNWVTFLSGFRITDLFRVSILEIAFPVFLGFFLVSFSLGLLTYVLILVILKARRR